MGSELAKSPYRSFLDDVDFKRWFENVKRGSVVTAHEWFRRMGYIQKRFGKNPKDIASLSPKDATNFILDVVSALEADGRSGNYISNCVKPLKSWLEFNGVQIQRKIKISKQGELTRFADERPPMPGELRKIFSAADLRARAACSLVAFAGLRLGILGGYLGNDGLQLHDFPEMIIDDNNIEFKRTPTIIVVRRSLSKARHQFFTFLCDEGCEYLKEYLEWRIRRGEKLITKSPLITPLQLSLAGRHIRTINIGDLMRKAIRDAGFEWRPYVLRRYFDTRLMMAENDGLIIRDWRVFFMGHKGDIEHTYTLNRSLPEDVIEKLRDAYTKAAEKYLITTKKETLSQDMVIATFNKQFLTMSGYTDEETADLGDLSKLTPQEIQELVKKKSMESLGLNGNNQKVVLMDDVKNWVIQGWEYVTTLPNNEAIVRLPKI